MSGDPIEFSNRTEQFRSYLMLLARASLAPHLRGKVDASDVVQQTMLEAHQDQHTYRGGSDAEYAAWLRRILVHNLDNLVRDFARDKRDVARERSLEAAVEDAASRAEWLAAEQSTPSQRADHRALVLRLADALSALPEDQRTVVELRHLEGWPLKRISEELQRTSAAVAGLLQRGLARLREQLCETSN